MARDFDHVASGGRVDVVDSGSCARCLLAQKCKVGLFSIFRPKVAANGTVKFKQPLDAPAHAGPSSSQSLRSPLSLFLCHPKPEAARLVIVDELNSSLFERCLDLEQSRNIARK